MTLSALLCGALVNRKKGRKNIGKHKMAKRRNKRNNYVQRHRKKLFLGGLVVSMEGR
jgi:hypothetical protein